MTYCINTRYLVPAWHLQEVKLFLYQSIDDQKGQFTKHRWPKGSVYGVDMLWIGADLKQETPLKTDWNHKSSIEWCSHFVVNIDVMCLFCNIYIYIFSVRNRLIVYLTIKYSALSSLFNTYTFLVSTLQIKPKLRGRNKIVGSLLGIGEM